MSWLELDDRILEHPKFIRAIKAGGSEIVHLWLGVRAYCGQLLTDGFCPTDMLDEVRGPRDGDRRAVALNALIEAGLFDRVDGGIVMHDYLDWSSSREAVLERRSAARDRKRRSRGTGDMSRRDGRVTHATHGDVTPLSVTDPRARDPLPLPSPPIPSGSVGSRDPNSVGKLNSSGAAVAGQLSALPAEGSLLRFPCRGQISEWHVVPSLVKRWRELFPDLDIGKECRAALAWVEASPGRQKTATGMQRFLVRWFGEAQNRGRATNGVHPRSVPITVGHARAEVKQRPDGEVDL